MAPGGWGQGDSKPAGRIWLRSPLTIEFHDLIYPHDLLFQWSVISFTVMDSPDGLHRPFGLLRQRTPGMLVAPYPLPPGNIGALLYGKKPTN